MDKIFRLYRSSISIGVFALQVLFVSQYVLAADIPNINTDLNFRSVVEEALDTQQSSFKFNRNGTIQRYFLGYQGDYLITHALRLNTFEKQVTEMLKRKLTQNPDPTAHHQLEIVNYLKSLEHLKGTPLSIADLKQLEDQAKSGEGSKFKNFLNKKATYQEEASGDKQTKKYSVYVNQRLYADQPTVTAKLGPYFSFTITQGQIPDINRDEAFHAAIETVLDHQQTTFTFQSGETVQHYAVDYGKDFFLAQTTQTATFKKVMSELSRDQIPQEISQKLNQLEDFSKMEKTTSSRKLFVEKEIQLEDSSEDSEVIKYSTQDQSTFTLRLLKNLEVPENDSLHDADKREIARLIIKKLEEEIAKCPELMQIKNSIDMAIDERMNSIDLTQEETEKLNLVQSQLEDTDKMLFLTQIMPKMNYKATVNYIRKAHPSYSEGLIFAILNHMGI